ncbi:MAG: Crp/Fnr family transcriptional regulator [Pseudomonadota bacterium]
MRPVRDKPIPLQLQSFFGALPEELRTIVASAGRARDYSDGAIVHRRGDKGLGLSVIEQGAVRFSRVDQEGSVAALTYLQPGDAYGEFAVFGDMPRAYDAEAVGPTRIRLIPATALEQLMDEMPDLRRHILQHLTRQLFRALTLLDDQRQLSLDKRIAKALTARSNADGDSVAITQEALAEDMAVSRVGLGKALNKLIEAGLIKTGYRRLMICDYQGLEAYWRG